MWSWLLAAPLSRVACRDRLNAKLSPGRHKNQITSSNNPFVKLVSTQQTSVAHLAILAPSDGLNAPIKLTLTNVGLKDTSDECISYDRSGDADSVTVSVNGIKQDIPRALESALRAFGRKVMSRTLWADLVVGRTVEEHSSQATSTKKVFDSVHDMANRWTQACLHVDVSQDAALGRITVQQLQGNREKIMDCPFDDLNSFDFALCLDIYSVFGSSYWNSMQCISKIVLAKQVIIVCGRSNIRWANFIAASRALPLFVQKGWEIISRIAIVERRRRLGEALELFPMIQTAQAYGANDPKTSCSQPLPTIDYSKYMQQVFTEAARYTRLERQDLVLWYAQRPPCGNHIKGLPSWVTDFSAVAVGTKPNTNPTGSLRMWWDALQPRKNIRISDDNGLMIQTYRKDHVSRIFDAGNAARLCFVEFQNLPTPTSEMIEERDTLIKLLDCTLRQPHNLEIAARMRDDPAVEALLPHYEKSELFDALLRRNAGGRRFFRTESGKFGMSAVEDVTCVNSSLRNPVTRMTMEGFQDFLAERNPDAVKEYEQTIRGELPTQQDDQKTSHKRGVVKSDIVVACMRGFFPYIIRPVASREDEDGNGTTS
ncbi:hypothetical protein HD806DRAFT_523665 [Xylariaceae sp. AK1471]|nr:hypothetical protein HD806DRAFT_523665 [Xylariaceae sp. AK1471]